MGLGGPRWRGDRDGTIDESPVEESTSKHLVLGEINDNEASSRHLGFVVRVATSTRRIERFFSMSVCFFFFFLIKKREPWSSVDAIVTP